MTTKILSSITALIFLWIQIAWAGNLTDYSVDNALERQHQRQVQMFAPRYLQGWQSSLKNLISQKQDIEDKINNHAFHPTPQEGDAEVENLNLQGPKVVVTEATSPEILPAGEGEKIDSASQNGSNHSLVTEEGDIIHVIDNQISYIEKRDGTVLRNLTFDENNNLIGAEIIYPDGTVQYISNGRVTRITRPDGTVINYNDEELIGSVVYPDGSVVRYAYIRDREGNITETILTDSEKIVYYDSENKLKRVVFNTGKIIEYDSGMLSKVIDEDGYTYIYEKTEVIVDGHTEYVVSLTEIIDNAGNVYEIENNNIAVIHLWDGTLVRDFELDESGNIVNGKIEYPDGTNVLIENGKIKEIEDINGVKTTYLYTLDVNNEVLSSEVTIDDYGDIKHYTYIRDPQSGNVIVVDGNKRYEFNTLWKLVRFALTLPDGTVKEYDADKNLIRTLLPDGTIYEYYKIGDFPGYLQKAILPDGKALYYTYKITQDGNLEVYKRFSYNNCNTFQSYYTEGSISYIENPALKANFRLDSTKPHSSTYISASYYKYQDKSVGFSINFYNQTPGISYHYYNYQTQESSYYTEELDITINKDTDYTVEYVWAGTGVEIYIYESSQTRPDLPLYTVTDNGWNPQFYMSANNAAITLDPSSSGTYRYYESMQTDYNNKLKGSPLYIMEFAFDGEARFKSLFHSIYGHKDTSYDSIYFNYYDSTSYLYISHYDYQTHQSTYERVPLDIAFNDDTTYILQTRIEDDTLKLYIYEKGTNPGAPLYTMGNLSSSFQIFSNIQGGQISGEVYDNAEVYQYNNTDGNILLRKRTTANETVTYIYDQGGNLLFKELLLEDGTKKTYDKDNRILKEEKPNGEGAVYNYDRDGNLVSITPIFPPDAILFYYETGPFIGNLKKVVLPDGEIIYYTYKITAEDNLKVYKRFSYDGNNFIQAYYGEDYIDRATNPTLKLNFSLQSTKVFSSVYTSAYYYKYNDKNASLSLDVFNNRPSIIRYSYRDYQTGEEVYESQELDLTIHEDVDYAVEYVWTDGDIDIYLYEASESRPDTPIYTINKHMWNPRFDMRGVNAALDLDPSSSGSYIRYQNIYTDYYHPLENPLHITKASFNQDGSYSKYLSYNIYGRTSTSYTSIYLDSYYNRFSKLRIYDFDYETQSYTYQTIPINTVIRDDTTYIIETKVDDNDTLELYLYPDATQPGGPIYTLQNVTWDANVQLSIYGGEIAVETYDNLASYEYSTQNQPLFDEDVEKNMQNKNVIIDDPYRNPPSYYFDCQAPLVFPDGITDIVNDKSFDFDFSIELPETNTPYFNIARYDQNSLIKEIIKPNGEILTYEDGLSTCFLTDLEIVLTTGLPDDVDSADEIKGFVNGILPEASNLEFIGDNFVVARDGWGRIVTYKLFGDKYPINSRLEGKGSFTIFDYDDTGNFAGWVKTLPNGEIEIYDGDGNIIERRIPDTSFMKGVNMPWVNYGYDLGLLPDSGGYHIGFSSYLEGLYTKLDSRKGDFMRLFLFCDLRSSINFDTFDNPIGFTDKVYDDMRTLLSAAEVFGIQLMPTLFDYTIADGVQYEGPYRVGEHPDLIKNYGKKEKLLNLFSGFFDEFADNPSIYAWDIINEPEYARAVTISDMQSFVSDFTSLIHSKAPDAIVTVGSRHRNDLVRYWKNVGLDLYQFHYYDNHESFTPLDYPASSLGLDKPVIAGELEPTSVTYKLDTLNNNGYAGGFFWEDDYYTITEEEYIAFKDWFSGTIIMYN